MNTEAPTGQRFSNVLVASVGMVGEDRSDTRLRAKRYSRGDGTRLTNIVRKKVVDGVGVDRYAPGVGGAAACGLCDE